MQTDTPHDDVIIVGAGLSGLSAAQEIITNKDRVTVRVLEARDRVGGRLCTESIKIDNNEYQYDVGGQWVCKHQTHILKTMKRLGIGHYKQYNKGKSVLYRRGTVYTYSGIIPFMLNWIGLLDLQWTIWQMDRLASQIDIKEPWKHPRAREWDSMTVASYTNTMWTQVGRDMVHAFCLAVFGTEPEELSLLFALFYIKSAGSMNNLIETEDGAQDSRVEGGAQNIPLKLASHILDIANKNNKSRCKIEYNCAVTKIIRNDDIYTIYTKSDRIFKCKYLIMAMPPALTCRIDYEPPLPSIRDQLCQHCPMAYMFKTNTFFKTPWWRTEDFAGFFTCVQDDNDHPLTYGFDGTSINAIVGFLCGNGARKWSSKTKQERIDAILKQYALMFGKTEEFVRDQFVGFAEKDWGMEPYSRGAPIGYFGPGGLINYGTALRTPIYNMHFAGTETAYHWNGYMSGAVEAGERAAQEVILKLNS